MIDKTISFIPINICVVTVSDTRSQENDKSGDLLKQRILGAGHNISPLASARVMRGCRVPLP